MFSHFQINVTMEFYKSTCDFILRETTTTKTKKRGKKKEEKPLVIYLQVRTSWNDKQIFKSTGVKILPSLWSTRNQRPLYAEFEEQTAGYMELKELAQRLQSAKEQCEDITNRLNQAKLTKEEANALLQQLAKLQTAPKQDTTNETIAPHKSTKQQQEHHTDEDEEEQTLLQKFIAHGQTNSDIEQALKIFASAIGQKGNHPLQLQPYNHTDEEGQTLLQKYIEEARLNDFVAAALRAFASATSGKKEGKIKLNFKNSTTAQIEKELAKYGVTNQRLETLNQNDIKAIESAAKNQWMKETANKMLAAFSSVYLHTTGRKISFKFEAITKDEDTIYKPHLTWEELQRVTADWLPSPLPCTSKRRHAYTGLFLIQCFCGCRVSDVAKVMDAIKHDMNKIQADIQESGAGQITYTTRKTDEKCFVPIFPQTLQIYERLMKDRNAIVLLERLREEERISQAVKKYDKRRATIKDVIKVLPKCETADNILTDYKQHTNEEDFIKRARKIDRYQRKNANTHLKNWAEELVKKGILPDDKVDGWTSTKGQKKMIWVEKMSRWKNLSTHCGRHTFASIAFGTWRWTPDEVCSVTGHKDSQMLMRYYVEMLAKNTRKSYESSAGAQKALAMMKQVI